jgi:hypothetical protein
VPRSSANTRPSEPGEAFGVLGSCNLVNPSLKTGVSEQVSDKLQFAAACAWNAYRQQPTN